MSNPRPAAIYGRISKDPGQTLAGVQRQVKDARDKLRQLPGVTLAQLDGSPVDRKRPELGQWPPGVFVDNDLSARKGTRARRPEYDRLMRHVSGGDLQVIIAPKQDRLWRNIKQAAEAIDRLKDLDTRIIFVATGEEYDLSQSEHKFRAGLMAVVNAWFTDDIAEKQQAATRRAAKEGAYHGARPFGFDIAHLNPPGAEQGTHYPPKVRPGERVRCPGCQGRPTNELRTLIPRPDETQAVREIFELAHIASKQPRVRVAPKPGNRSVTVWKIMRYLDGYPIELPDGTIRRRDAILTASGHTWESQGLPAVINVLGAQRNIGMREHSKWDGGKRPPGELTKANWDGIVDPQVFYDVQDWLKDRAASWPRTGAGRALPAHLLTGGIAVCGTCGASMIIHKVNGKRRYACPRSGKGDAPHPSYEAGPAEREVTRFLYEYLAVNGMLTKALVAAGNTDLQKLDDRLTRLKEQQGEIEDKFTDQAFDRDDPAENEAIYRRQKARKREQITECLAEMEKAAMLAPGTPGQKPLPVGREFRKFWTAPGTTLEERRQLIKRFIARVVIHPVGAGNKPNPLMIQVFPGEWASGLDEVQPLAVPDPDSVSARGRILAFLREHQGQWFSRAEIIDGAGVTKDQAHKNLLVLGSDGSVGREWRRRGGERACWMYSTAESGTAWRPRAQMRKQVKPGETPRMVFLRVMTAEPDAWFPLAKLARAADISYPHASKVMKDLLAGGFVARRRQDRRPRSPYVYSVSGKVSEPGA
jgi:DNA invertase Pin-like site-specific DNA recombinase